MKKVILSFAILGLTACGHSSDSSNGGGAPGGQKQELKNVTTSAECQNGAAANSLIGKWMTVLQSRDITVNTSFNFSNGGSVEVSNECVFQGGSLTASVEAPYSSSGSTLTFPIAASRREGNEQMNCSVGLAKASIQYGFEGSCLVLIDGRGQKVYFTHAF